MTIMIILGMFEINLIMCIEGIRYLLIYCEHTSTLRKDYYLNSQLFTRVFSGVFIVVSHDI